MSPSHFACFAGGTHIGVSARRQYWRCELVYSVMASLVGLDQTPDAGKWTLTVVAAACRSNIREVREEFRRHLQRMVQPRDNFLTTMYSSKVSFVDFPSHQDRLFYKRLVRFPCPPVSSGHQTGT